MRHAGSSSDASTIFVDEARKSGASVAVCIMLACREHFPCLPPSTSGCCELQMTAACREQRKRSVDPPVCKRTSIVITTQDMVGTGMYPHRHTRAHATPTPNQRARVPWLSRCAYKVRIGAYHPVVRAMKCVCPGTSRSRIALGAIRNSSPKVTPGFDVFPGSAQQ